MFNLITIIVGLASLFFVTVGAALVNVGIVLPNVLVIVVAYAAARRDVFGALLTALALGLCAGVLAGDGRGAMLLSLLPVIGATRWVAARLPLDRIVVAAGWAVAAVLLADLSFVLLVSLLSPGRGLWRALTAVTPGSALLSGLFALPIYAFLGWVEPLIQERHEKSSLFH